MFWNIFISLIIQISLTRCVHNPTTNAIDRIFTKNCLFLGTPAYVDQLVGLGSRGGEVEPWGSVVLLLVGCGARGAGMWSILRLPTLGRGGARGGRGATHRGMEPRWNRTSAVLISAGLFWTGVARHDIIWLSVTNEYTLKEFRDGARLSRLL